jgi:hypothetical protein
MNDPFEIPRSSQEVAKALLAMHVVANGRIAPNVTTLAVGWPSPA